MKGKYASMLANRGLILASILDTNAQLTHGMVFQSLYSSINSDRILGGFVDDNTGGTHHNSLVMAMKYLFY